MKINCNRCGQEFTAMSALVFSPPFNHGDRTVAAKYHVCVKCWDELYKWLTTSASKEPLVPDKPGLWWRKDGVKMGGIGFIPPYW